MQMFSEDIINIILDYIPEENQIIDELSDVLKNRITIHNSSANLRCEFYKYSINLNHFEVWQWHAFENPNFINILTKYLKKHPNKVFNKTEKTSITNNPLAIDFLDKYPQFIDFRFLSRNPKAIKLLRKYPEKICYIQLAGNPNGIDLFLENLHKANFEFLGRNPCAIDIIERFLNEPISSYNNVVISVLSILRKIPVCSFVKYKRNPDPADTWHLIIYEKYKKQITCSYNIIKKYLITMYLCKNYNATHLIRKYIDSGDLKITTNVLYDLATNHQAINILSEYIHLLDITAWSRLINYNKNGYQLLDKCPEKNIYAFYKKCPIEYILNHPDINSIIGDICENKNIYKYPSKYEIKQLLYDPKQFCILEDYMFHI